VGDFCEVSNSVARDFFHNTWSKQFFINVKAFKPELDEIMTNDFVNGFEDKLSAQHAVVDALLEQHKSEQIHMRTLQQYVGKLLKRFKFGKERLFDMSQLIKLVQKKIL